VHTWEPLEKLASAWGRAISKNRDTLFFAALVLSSLVALLPFARESSISNFFVYALLPIVFVFANSKKFLKVDSPDGLWFLVAVAIIIGSFLFNSFMNLFSQGGEYGLTDYVILVVGMFALFYTAQNKLVRFGIYTLVFVRGATLILSKLSATLFVGVSNALVSMVVFFSKIFVSPSIHAGNSAGEVVAVGAAGTNSVFIGWACVGLEELVLTTVLILILIKSFDMSVMRTSIWLAIGIAGSFLINIARMVILIWVAADYGTAKMLWVHTHLGDVLFLVWIGIFWLLFFKFGLPRRAEPKAVAT
jgi:archaeosortase C (PEF-CTERM variant)